MGALSSISFDEDSLIDYEAGIVTWPEIFVPSGLGQLHGEDGRCDKKNVQIVLRRLGFLDRTINR